jgi:hypothetical protein
MFEEHPEYFVPKMASSFLSSRGGATRNIPSRHKNSHPSGGWAMGIKSEGVAEGLDCKWTAPRDGPFSVRTVLLHVNLQGFPAQRLRARKKFSIIQESTGGESSWMLKIKCRWVIFLRTSMPEPFAEFHHTFCGKRGKNAVFYKKTPAGIRGRSLYI